MRELIKAARDLLGLSQAQLCEMAEVPLITLRRIEGKPDHAGLVSNMNVAKVMNALELAGVSFLEDGEQSVGGPGVRLRR